ncbi:uncharacterized protein LOC110617629 isoform X2 [Manihot esculenta]|uniref:Uncharacterized protein n=1 Tax=Manihot esculenta TaxID=3983 RepID=A0A2C9VPF9_MANES|nr:uncharacterized protein LOC110617629 isoform X2 [Manihot esculenta]OAY47701.1 hypothetical protein MANES_06G099300v8 [Manihot esculenta]
MADSEKLTALKKAYADIILNTAKEAAARIMVSERKAQRYQRELFAAKDESLRMLLRLKQMLDSKVSEAEMTSLSQQRRIEELEAQLGEAEDIVKDLRAELRELQDELEKVTNSQMQPLGEQNLMGENGTRITAFEDNRLSTSGSAISAIPALQCDPVTSIEMKNSTLNGTCDENKCYSENDCHKDKCFVCNPDFASIVMRSKVPELYRNGCTQRIRAFERHLLGGNLPLSGQADDVKNQIFIKADEEDKDMCKQLTAKVDNICDLEKGPDVAKDIEAGNRIRRRRRKRNLSRFGQAENVRNQIFIREEDNHTYKNLTAMANIGCDVEKSQDVAKDDGGGIPRRLRIKRYRKRRDYKIYPHQAVDDIVQTKEDSKPIDNLSQKDPMPLVAPKSPSSTNEMLTQSESVETKSESEFDRTCSFQTTNSNKLSTDELELAGQDIGSAENLEFPPSKTDFDVPGVLLSNPIPKEPDVTEAVPTQSSNNKFLKYTFQRKRKRELPSSPDGDSSPNISSLKKKMGEKTSGSTESLKSGMIAESSRDNRRMAQVARQAKEKPYKA